MATPKINTIAMALPARTGFIELRGHRITLAGVQSHEPLLRGCDQADWLRRMTAHGLRHLVIPLNGIHEDVCLYQRSHPSQGAPQSVLYDLEHRNEGVYARLKFLLDTAGSEGILTGLSLFDASPAANTPFVRNANAQGLALSEPVDSPDGIARLERLRNILNLTIDWIAAEIRGRQGIWIEIFRHAARGSSAAALERELIQRLTAALSKHRDPGAPNSGPWIASDSVGPLSPPFDVARAEPRSPENLFDHSVWERHRARVTIFDAADLPGSDNSKFWRAMMRSGWPVAQAAVLDDQMSRTLVELGELARFGQHWAARGELRPASEVLAAHYRDELISGHVLAATDGCGRFYIFFSRTAGGGATLSLPPGTYRYIWVDPTTGRMLDHGDGIDGTSATPIPGVPEHKLALLIVHNDQLPDPLSIW